MMQAKQYPYNTNAVSEEQFDQHVQLYRGYVDKVNEITDDLRHEKHPVAANATYSKYRGLKKGETYALDGVILHEGYFQNMTTKVTTPGQEILNVINESYGNFDNWLDDFTNCATSARGWCLFLYEQRSKSFRNILLDSHDNGIVCLAFPLLILDMYEHAYFLDYGKDKASYIKAFNKSVCWDTVGMRLKKLRL